ncbi:hypothetical protein SAMN04487948_12639 [Halogranum amylolyticum]|uniref:Uncharacterized protein n=2 Tax=Halogranum amylolyticum TaxID=660520 RepID=A0A1H8WBU3_9EURY|nr:hypothetical protein SAMN04487948_12639 [Halogranum amylolyticum]
MDSRRASADDIKEVFFDRIEENRTNEIETSEDKFEPTKKSSSLIRTWADEKAIEAGKGYD